MKRFSSNLQAFCSIAALAGGSVATYYILGPRLQRPMVSACATIMLVPPVLWLFLLIIKRDDHEFLQLVMRPLRTLELLFWVPGFVAGVASALLSYRGPLLLLGVTLGSVGAAFGMMKYWIKRQLGLEESSAEGWWPAKHD